MSHKEHGNIQHRQKGVKRQSGAFICNGTSDPATLRGKGFTPTYIGVGVWKVTLDGPYRQVISVVAMPGNTALPSICQVDSIVEGATNATSFYVRLFTQDAVTFELLPANYNSGSAVRVHFSVDLSDIGAQ